MAGQEYVCPKCGGTEYETDQFQATGGFLTRLFDVQNKRFLTVSCTNCGYTDLFKGRGSTTTENILDFLFSR